MFSSSISKIVPRKSSLNQPPALKVALVHDYLREYGGAERVLEVLHQLFPEAPVYTAFFDAQALGQHAARFEGWQIHQTWLAKIPFIKKLFSPLRFLAPKAFADLDLANYNLVISSSNAYFAKAVRVPNGQHICYCHTPPRALYGYNTMSDWKKNWLVRVGGEILNHYLRVIDFQVSQKVDFFVANSLETARRIQKFYRRESCVIFPPVGLAVSSSTQAATQNQPSINKQNFYLYVNRLAWAKHPEIAVSACLQANLPLKVVDAGPMLPALKQLLAKWPTQHQIELLGAVDDAKLQQLYQSAKALIYPVEDEDFGMIPVEAMLAGTPVIAHNSGGPKETVVPSVSGILFDELSVAGLLAALEKFAHTKFSAAKLQNHAAQYSVASFKTAMLKFVSKVTKTQKRAALTTAT